LNIYLLRHAQSEGNKERRFFGVTHTPLSDKGKASLTKINAFLENKTFDKIYCSPLERCVDTAKLSFGNAADITIDPELIEINFGDWEGKHLKEVMQSDPDAWERYQNDWMNFSFPNGDTIKDYQAKVQAVVARIISETDAEATIALVSHNGFIKAAMSYLMVGDNSLADRLSVQNATINWIELLDGTPKLRLLNYLQEL